MEQERRLSREKLDLYEPLWPIARAGLGLKFDRNVTGIEHIPEGPAMYTPNHILFVDSPLVAVSYTEVTGKPLRFGAKKEYFEGKGMDDKGKLGRSMKWVMEHGRMIPVERESKDRYAINELQQRADRAFARGDAVALHPEGTRSDDGRLHKFKRGAAVIAIASEVPIVPVGIVYSNYSNGRKTHADIMFGEPILPDEYHSGVYGLLAKKPKAEAITMTIESRVAALTGMDQTGVFAVLKKLRHLGPNESSE